MAAKQRVQGIHSHLEDVTLHSGKSLTLALGPVESEAPTLTRSIGGASTIEVPVIDPKRRLLRRSLLAQKWNAKVDGLRFRYAGLSKSGDQLTLTLEDLWIAKLREAEGPKRALRSQMTRAEFIKKLVEEACGRKLRFYCPQLHKKQPIKSKKQAEKADEEARENRGKGIGDAKHLKVKGQKATKSQLKLGQTALRIAEAGNAPAVCRVAVIAALIVESNMGAEDPGNVLQATGSTPKGSAEEQISGFLFGEPTWTGVTAVGYHKSHPDASFYEIAQAVQKSGAGEGSGGRPNYGQFGAEAREWVDAYEGGEGTVSLTVDEPYIFEVKKGESYWSAIKRLAKEVNWRAFVVADVFYFMPETELIASMVRLAIDGDMPGLESVDFDYDTAKPVTEVTLTALVGKWRPPPGSVVTLAGYGPASIGFGDAPVKADKQGRKAGISSNRVAATGEGRARYLVSSIEVPLIGDPAQRLATITLRKPTRPLPEPAPETKTISGVQSSAAGNKTVERVLAFCEREAERNPPYVWGGYSKSGYDCSGFVSAALNTGGWLSGRLDTKGLTGWGEAGAGEYVTVYVKTGTGSAHTEHTFIEVAGKFFQSGGGENDSASGGVVEFSPSQSYLKEFTVKRHPKGA